MKTQKLKNRLMTSALILGCNLLTFAQGKKGIDTATTEIKTYYGSVSDLIMAIGAVVGLVGGIRVYIKWNNGDQDVNKSIMSWFGACIFLVLVGVVIKAFFGVNG
ncbi:MAG: DUF4134 domain-containing protein [Flavobacteriaceae bacterium]|nr:DUF4134 domain-containing protein [Flavobacteriaceae bacterium]